LGFETLKYNSVAAQMSRENRRKTLAFAMSSVAQLWLNFLWTCVYMSQNFDFIGLPAHLTRFEHHATQENLM
jgi:argininosuccinate lyase